MDERFSIALRAGTESVAAWADLLDRINVFPVADGDTGRNLLISLLPLKSPTGTREALIEQILLAARGNSGNIAAQFFTGFLSFDGLHEFPEAVRRGAKHAWQAVADPRPGTMLSIFDELEAAVRESRMDDQGGWVPGVLKRLERSVLETTQALPVLEAAKVVDSGALGMFIYFDAFLNSLYGKDPQFAPMSAAFRDRLAVSDSWAGAAVTGDCVDAVVRVEGVGKGSVEDLTRLGESVVAHEHGGYIKIHMHTGSGSAVREALSRMGAVVRWASDDLEAQTKVFSSAAVRQAVHIVTDAAGSVTRGDARRLNMTLLDSYITVGDQDAPETQVDAAGMYRAMKEGVKVTTSQASVFERRRHYEKVLCLYGRALYLCVGSAYTGNYRVVMDWKKDHDPDDRLTVIDTGAASGRLGLIALAVSRHACAAESSEAVQDFAARAVASCEEYIFLDTLKFLAAGGRMSKTGAFVGDMLRMKPVVSPSPEGAKKVAVVRHRRDQVALALDKIERLEAGLRPQDHPAIMLEYTDNKEWIECEIAGMVRGRFPRAEIIVQSFSLTSGAHMGPGTWGVAFLPWSDSDAASR